MGGFASALANVGKEAIEREAPRVEKTLGQEARHVYENIRPIKHIFEEKAKTDPVVNHFWNKSWNKDYKEALDFHTTRLTKQAIGAGSSMPAADITSQAKQIASETAFGPQRNRIQGFLKYVEKAHGKNTADIMSDHLNILFREGPEQQGLKKGQSKFDIDMLGKPKYVQVKLDNGETVNKMEYGENSFDGPPTPYKPGGRFEKLGRVHQSLLAWKAAIPHLATQLNVLHEAGLINYTKTLNAAWNPYGAREAKEMLVASNAASESWINSYREHQDFESGRIAKHMPGGVGAFIHENYHTPLMPALRRMTIAIAAHSGKYEADAAIGNLLSARDTFKSNPNSMIGKMKEKKALFVLRKLGLDTEKLASQNFKFTPEDIDKIYHHSIDQKAFSSYPENRSAFSQATPIRRTMFAFHAAVASQANFFKRTFTEALKNGDVVGLSRQLAMITIAYPIVGAVIMELEQTLTGQTKHPIDGFIRKAEATPGGVILDHMMGRKNPYTNAQITMNTVDNLSHIGAYGVVTGYARAAGRSNLAGQILGPDANMVVQAGQDVIKALKTDSNHPDAWEALGRDAMADFIPFEGNKLAHTVLPTTRDKNAGKFHKFRINRKLKKQTSNPLNANINFDR